MGKLSDQWQTPMWLFDQLNEEFNFDIDLAATRENSKCKHFCWDFLNSLTGSIDSNCIGTIYDYLEHEVVKGAAFCNPPYSDPKPFIEKCWELSKQIKIVMLVKCDPSTRWWSTFWDYTNEYMRCGQCNSVQIGREFKNDRYCMYCSLCYRSKLVPFTGPKPGCEVRFFPKRIKFDPPQQLINSGEVWKVGTKWVQKCAQCNAKGVYDYKCPYSALLDEYNVHCGKCKGKGYKELSGPTFSSALLIFDRRGL